MVPSSDVIQGLVDLHVHLGALTTPHFLWELAHEQGIRLVEKDYWDFIHLVTVKKKISSDKYLRRLDIPEDQQTSPFYLTQRIQSSPYAIERCIHEALSYMYRKVGVTHVEIRFNPMLRNRGGEHDLDKIIFSATIGLKKASLEYPITAGLILETDRQFTRQQHETIARKAVAFAPYGVVGFDVSGPSPTGFRIIDLARAVHIVREGGLGVTIHTGEVTSLQEMWEVVESLHPDRIGHGIVATQDSKLMKRLQTERIVLELCPTSNIRTGVVRDWKTLGSILHTFDSHGVLYTINSDGPVFLDTTVRKELEILLDRGIISENKAKQLMRLSHKASFIQR